MKRDEEREKSKEKKHTSLCRSKEKKAKRRKEN